jgi:hypothetical protein
MLSIRSIHTRQPDSEERSISHISPQGLLPEGQTLAINLEARTLSLLSEGPILIVEQQLSANEMHMLLPLLDYFPHYCPYEVFLAHLSTKVVNDASIERCAQRLLEAQAGGRWHQELRPVRRALSSLRNKLYRFSFGISNVRERGCSLVSLTARSPDHSSFDVT